MVQIKNTLVIISLILLAFNFTCKGGDTTNVAEETTIDLQELNTKLKDFLDNNKTSTMVGANTGQQMK